MMRDFIKKKKHSWGIYIFLLAIVLVVFAPHFQVGIWEGLDDSFHLSRIYSLSQSIQNGVFPVKVHASLCYGTGYGVGFGYSNLFLYIPALLLCMGFPLIQAYKIYVFLVLTALCFTVYFVLLRLTNDVFSSLIGCLVVMFSNRIWWDIYGLMSIGSLQASIFIILAIVGMYRFLTIKGVHSEMLIVGFTGLIYSHTISTLLTFTVCACMMVYFLKEVLLKNRKKIIELLLAVVLVSSVTMGFWLPMIEQMKAQILKLRAPWTTAEEHISTLSSMLSINELGIMPVIMLIVCCIGIILLLNLGKWGISDLHYKSCFGIISIIYISITMLYPFWHFMNSAAGIKIVQFPYRLYTPVTFLIAIQVATVIADFDMLDKKKRSILLGGGTVILLLVLAIWQYSNYSQLFTSINTSTIEEVENNKVAGLGGGEEWLPINGAREYMYDPNLAIDNEGNCVRGEKSQGFSSFKVMVDKSKEYYDLPYVYYKGYQAIGMNGNKYELDCNYATGMLRIFMPQNAVGNDTIVVKYVGTQYQKLAYVITISSVVICFMLVLLKSRLYEWMKCC